MIDVDFLFVYEIKNREIENICLLKYELERRGYTTAFLNMWTTTHYKYPKYNAKVIVAFGVYNNSQAEWFPTFGGGTKKLVNLQWEQLFLVVDEESAESVNFIREKAVNAVHIAWGDFNVERLISRCNVKKNNVELAGHLSMDFLKPRLAGYYMSKEALCKQYGLNEDKKIFLFISSFTYQSLPEKEMTERAASKMAVDAFEQRKLNIESQKSLLIWIKNTLAIHPEIEFVYRPHPAELFVDNVLDIEKECPNFHIINELTIKQWITVSDKIYTWISTSVAEIYAAGKTCSVVRPIPIKPEEDMRIYHNCKVIDTEQEFKDTFLDDVEYPFDIDMLKYYYKLDDKYTYEKICNKLEDVYKNDEYNYDFVSKEGFIHRCINLAYKFVRRNVARCVAKLYLSNNSIIKALSNKKITKGLVEDAVFAEKMIINQVVTNDEIENYTKKIANIIENNQEI